MTELETILDDYIRSIGGRRTIERQIILKQIESYKQRHFMAERLIEDICEKEHISRSSIYNALQLFEQAHIVSRVGNSLRGNEYEICRVRKKSMRYVCVSCGREVRFEDKAIDNILRSRKFSNFDMTDYSLNVYGKCKVCRSKKAKQK